MVWLVPVLLGVAVVVAIGEARALWRHWRSLIEVADVSIRGLLVVSVIVGLALAIALVARGLPLPPSAAVGALALLTMVVACGSAPPPPAPPPVASGPPPIRCDGGRELAFSRELPNGDVTTLTVRCDDEHVTASAETIAEPAQNIESDAPRDIRERGGPVEIDHALFDRVWRGAFARAAERGCKRRRDRASTTALTLRDAHEKREVTCFDLDATDVLEPLRAAVKLEKIAPPPVVDDEHFQWPYRGEYWKDELRYSSRL